MSLLGRKKQKAIYLGFGIIWALFAFGFASASASYSSKSANFELIDPSVGGTGLVNSSSKNYQALQSGALIGIGTSTSSTYQVQAGHETTGAPTLAFALLSSGASFGTFSTSTTSTANAQFEVLDYTSYGYVVQIYGDPPTDPYGNKITALSTNAAPSVGVDQFGLNLVANTNPITFGAGPNYGQFGSGTVAPNYDTPNSYRFVSGEEIASAGKSSGLTVYTISYIVDVNNLTPGGVYVSTQSIICTATY